MSANWYKFSAQDDDQESVEVSIYDEIGAYGVSARDFMRDIQAHEGKHIHVRINSPGGSVIDGTAIFNALTRHKGGVTIHIDALAASMASVIAMAGAPVLMAENAMLMVHNPWTIAAGDADELRKTAGLLDRLKDSIVSAYRKKTGMADERIAQLMDAETWLSAIEAVALGFVDALEPEVEAFALADAKARFDKFANHMTENLEPKQEPEGKVDINALQSAISDLQAKLKGETARADEAVAKVAEQSAVITTLENSVTLVTAERDERADLLNKLEESLGLTKAAAEPELKHSPSEATTILDQWNAITDASERTAFYRQHKAEIKKFLRAEN